MTIGILPLARPTFDVSFAEEKLAAMMARLDATDRSFAGPRELLFDADQTRAALAALQQADISSLLILQVTFTDASMAVEAVSTLDVPLAIWAIPEPRSGGRLRLNAFCGLNLASHALGLNGRQFSWLYGAPDTVLSDDVIALLNGARPSGHLVGIESQAPDGLGRAVAEALRGYRIGRIGDHPAGFGTCAYSSRKLADTAGVAVDEIDLGRLFDTARGISADRVTGLRAEAEEQLDGLDSVDQDQLDCSLRLKLALSDIRENGSYDAFAIRCWPETFTEYGGAVCGPISMMGEARIPCACEADVYGALTQLILQAAARAPVFLTDLVDIDIDDDSAVVWHCGQAPISMCKEGARVEATVHSNRKMPLLYQFALKPGRVTLARVSQSYGMTQMILAGAEMLDRPMAFTGTSGTLRFDSGSRAALDAIIASGLEHHMALAYGDHRETLKSVATAMNLPVLEF